MFRNTLLTVSILLIAHHVLAAEAETKPAADKRPTKIWNRTGPLGETPKHITDAYPLSDQDNRGGWVKFEPMSDEFGGKELDRSKWVMGIEGWKGRQPALFSEKNVTVSDGKLHLTMRKEKLPAEAENDSVFVSFWRVYNIDAGSTGQRTSDTTREAGVH